MQIEVNVTITVEAGDEWNFRVNDALRNVGSEIYMNPEFVIQKGEGTDFTFEYTVKGIGK
jgi:hypothetical protein